MTRQTTTTHATTNALSIYEPGKNCRALGTASHARILVDYATYYDALHQSILKAKRSIFIIGWDIDSRIELLRGEDAEGVEATCLFDLLCKKAKENPELQIYLNKWDYSYFFMKQREPFWDHKWESCDLPNIHHCLDGMVPLGACHHQKIAVIDDEVAFWGGMDVAQGRWDKRQHYPKNQNRADPGGLPTPDTLHRFGPYHDIQAVLAGPAVELFAQQVRERWALACESDAIPYHAPDNDNLPPTWPDRHKPQFENVDIAVARTVPPMRGHKGIHEIRHLLKDEIAQAESFIYIENQYVACEEIARALNKALRNNPQLRVLIVSCDKPQGTMEAKTMWAGRVRFRDILESGDVGDRVAMVHPASRVGDTEKPVHIHSKLMVIDDKYLHVGSANLARRSMGLDTEWDISLIGTNATIRKQIDAVRNDLIREHCGREIDDIQSIISTNQSVQTFLKDVPTSRQHFRALDDSAYRDLRFMHLARMVGDPKRPLIPTDWTIRFHRGTQRRPLHKTVMKAGIALLVLAALALVWRFTPLSEYANAQNAASLFGRAGDSTAALFWGVGLYTLGGCIFFPITVMTAASVIAFGPIKGVIVAFVGALLSGVIGFGLGRWFGKDRLKNIFGNKTDYLLGKIKNAGVIGVAVIRSVPIAPYPLANMVFGTSGVPLLAFVLGTFFGLLPGKVALALAGDSLVSLFKDPSASNMIYLGVGLSLWVLAIWGSHKLARKWQKK